MMDFRNLIGGRTSGQGRVEVRSAYYDMGFTIPEGDEGELKAALAAALASKSAIDALSLDERAEIIRGALGRLELGEKHLDTARMTGYPVKHIRRSWDRFREGFLEFLAAGPGRSEARARPMGFLLLPDNVDIISPWAIFSAVYAGCPLVVKAGSLFPWVPLAVSKALAEAGYPEGGVNILFFRGPTAPYLARRAMREVLGREGTFVGFGRDSTLRAILGDDGALAVEALLKGCFVFFGSGKSQGVVCRDADHQTAVKSITESLLLPPFSCLNPKVLYMEEGTGELVPRLVEAVRGLKVGDPLDDGTDIGYVDGGVVEEVERIVRYSEGFGASRLLGRPLGGNQAEPYLIRGIPQDFNPLEREDYPVPILGLIEGSAEEIVRRSNAVGKALVTSIFTREIRPIFGEIKTYHLHLNKGTRTTMLTGHQGVDLWRAFQEEVRRG